MFFHNSDKHIQCKLDSVQGVNFSVLFWLQKPATLVGVYPLLKIGEAVKI